MQFEPVGLEPQGPDKKRLFLAVTMMMFMWFGYVEWITQNAPPPQAPTASPTKTDEPAVRSEVHQASKGNQVENSEAQEATAPLGTPAAKVEALSHVKATILKKAMGKDAELVEVGYDISLTNYGAQIKAYELTGYQAVPTEDGVTDGKKNNEWVDLTHGEVDKVYLMGLSSRGGDVALRPTDTYELVSKNADGLIYERMTHEGVKIRRHYKFSDKDFSYEHTISIENEGNAGREIQFDLQMSGKQKAGDPSSGMMSPMGTSLGASCHGTDEEHHRVELSDLEDGPLNITTPLKHVAMDDQYFLHALIPNPVDKASCHIKLADSGDPAEFVVSLSYPAFKIRPGEKVSWSQTAYAGPKELDVLLAFGHGLENNVDFGWFGVIARPMLWVLMQNYGLIGNFGLAIILLTMIVKLITFPLTQKSYVSMQQMKTIAPELKALQKKYAHDRQLQGQKQMELYREKGINPMAGCLPMFIQMPIWIALYRTLWGSVELYQQPFFGWLVDLTLPDPLYILPVLMGGTMAIQTAFQPAPEDQPQMKYIMWGMPIFLTFIMLSLPAGLSLYMLTNNLLTIIQQAYIKKKYT